MKKEKKVFSGEPLLYEAYRQIRVNLLYTLATAQNNVILFTSPLSNEGKSVTTTNLGTVIAQTNSRVVIVDADMRKPEQHRYLQVPNKDGLSMVLSNLCSLEDAICEVTPPYLSLIPAGYSPPNPSELLSSNKMQEVIETLSKNYDYVLIDTPPVNIVSDCLNIIDKAAGVVILTRQKKTTYSELQRAIEKINNVDGKILGVIVNDVKERYKAYKDYKKFSRYYQ